MQEKENQTELLESEAIDRVTTISGSKLRQQCNSNFSVKTSNIMGWFYLWGIFKKNMGLSA